jgi:hypothetical protein
MRLDIVPGGIFGHCDLFDVDTLTVIDHKVVGAEKHREYKRNGPGMRYRSQAHLYGKGWAHLGLTPKEVAIAFYPRGGLLSGLYVWSEPYDPSIADAALQRMDAITEAAVVLDVEHHPERYAMFEAETGHHCTYCPWLQPGSDTGKGCPGHLRS